MGHLPLSHTGLPFALAFALLCSPAGALIAQSPPQWVLEAVPEMTIGEESGAPPLSRVFGAVRLPDGGVLLADGSPAVLLRFDARGQFVGQLGRAGAGPGEYRRIAWFDVAGDTIFVADGELSRLTRFSMAGTVLSTMPLTLSHGGLRFTVIGRWPDGGLLVQSLTAYSGGGHQGAWRDSTVFATVVGEQPPVRLTTAPGFMAFVQEVNGRWSIAPAAFAPMTMARIVGNRLYIGDNAAEVVRTMNRAGGALAPVPVPYPPEPLPPELVRRRRAADVAAASAARRSFVEAKYEPAALPRSLPRYSAFYPLADGRVWFVSYAAEAGAVLDMKLVSTAGQVVGELRLPPGSQVLSVGPDRLVAVYEDADGVPTVRVHRIRAP